MSRLQFWGNDLILWKKVTQKAFFSEKKSFFSLVIKKKFVPLHRQSEMITTSVLLESFITLLTSNSTQIWIN